MNCKTILKAKFKKEKDVDGSKPSTYTLKKSNSVNIAFQDNNELIPNNMNVNLIFVVLSGSGCLVSI